MINQFKKVNKNTSIITADLIETKTEIIDGKLVKVKVYSAPRLVKSVTEEELDNIVSYIDKKEEDI